MMWCELVHESGTALNLEPKSCLAKPTTISTLYIWRRAERKAPNLPDMTQTIYRVRAMASTLTFDREQCYLHSLNTEPLTLIDMSRCQYATKCAHEL